MFKKFASAAFAVVAISALGQTTTQQTTTTTTTTTTTAPINPDATWREKYDTYHIGSVDLGSISWWDMHRVVNHNLRDVRPSDAYTISNFLQRIPADDESVMVKALVNNYRQACIVRDEVAMARFGTDQTYAWLTYPPLTWSDTPGQNSWSTLTFNDNGSTTATTTTVTTGPLDDAVALTDDQSRPMRMIMSNRMSRADIDYDRAVDILCSGMDNTERGAIVELFHPMDLTTGITGAPNYTNEEALDAIIHLIQNNAMMVHYLDRFSWYNHFDPAYYTSGRYEWGY
jgi:hypothetical protein